MSSPLLNITLPTPIVLPSLHLTGLYTCILGLDYLLLKNQTHLYFIPKKYLRIGMTLTHVILPLTFISPHSPTNVAFAAVPWFLASYSVNLPNFNFKSWSTSLYNTIIDHHHKGGSSSGLIKSFRGLLKLSILYFIIDPLLPTQPNEMLLYPWFSSKSLLDTFLFGLKAYLVLGGMDVISGGVQLVTGWCMVDMFDSPFLATSPIDFWSKRWNRTIRNLLHDQVFTSNRSLEKSSSEKSSSEKNSSEKNSSEKNSSKKNSSIEKTSFFSTNTGRGLLSFVISGAFHELIICSVCRKLTLENFTFFSLHGLACMLESKYFKEKKHVGYIGHASKIVCQLGLMVLTGRLFLAPFLRHRFTDVLPLTY